MDYRTIKYKFLGGTDLFFKALNSFMTNKVIVLGSISILILLSYINHLPHENSGRHIYQYIKIGILCILSAYIFSRFYLHRFKLFTDEIILIVYIIFTLISALVVNKELALSVFEPLAFGISFFGISSFWLVNNDHRHIIRILVILLIFSSIDFIIAYVPNTYQIIIQHDYKSAVDLLRSNNLWTGLLQNTNRIGYSMMISFFCSASLFFYYLKAKRHYFIQSGLFILTMLFTAAVLISQSRNCIMAVVIYTIVEIIILRREIREALLNNKYYFTIIFFVTSIFVLLAIRFKLFDIVIDKTVRQGTTHRFSFWVYFLKDLINNFDLSHFIFGKGYKGDINIYTKIIQHHETSLHNFFLENLGRFGIFAAVSFTAFIAFTLKKVFRNKSISFVMGIPVAFIFYSFFEDLLFFTYLWMESFLFLFILYAFLRLDDPIPENKRFIKNISIDSDRLKNENFFNED